VKSNNVYGQGCSANKKMWERTQKLDMLKQLQTHSIAIHQKRVGTPFPRVPTLLHLCTQHMCCWHLKDRWLRLTKSPA